MWLSTPVSCQPVKKGAPIAQLATFFFLPHTATYRHHRGWSRKIAIEQGPPFHRMTADRNLTGADVTHQGFVHLHTFLIDSIRLSLRVLSHFLDRHGEAPAPA